MLVRARVTVKDLNQADTLQTVAARATFGVLCASLVCKAGTCCSLGNKLREGIGSSLASLSMVPRRACHPQVARPRVVFYIFFSLPPCLDPSDCRPMPPSTCCLETRRPMSHSLCAVPCKLGCSPDLFNSLFKLSLTIHSLALIAPFSSPLPIHMV
jgi:hypothetical protein